MPKKAELEIEEEEIPFEELKARREKGWRKRMEARTKEMISPRLRILKELFEDHQIHRKATFSRINIYDKFDLLPSTFSAELFEIASKYKELEERLATLMDDSIKSHPLWIHFLSRVKGLGPVLACGIVGMIENVVNRFCKLCDTKQTDILATKCEKCGSTDLELRKGIRAFGNISKLVTYCGLAPSGVRRRRGKKIVYNPILKTLFLGRMWIQINKTKQLLIKRGKNLPRVYEHYLDSLKHYTEGKYQGVLEDPTRCPRYSQCVRGLKKRKKPACQLHLRLMAWRRTMRDFVGALWLVWRQIEGLPITKPFPVERQAHQKVITAQDLMD